MTPNSLVSVMTCRGVITILVVILGQVVVGSYNTFNVTLLAIKEKFNFTQTDVEVVLSAITFGFGTGMPSGVLLDRYGPKMASVWGLLVTLPSFGLLYLATRTEEFFHDKAMLLAVIAFFAGHGMFMTFTITWTTGARQADPRIRGFLFGLFKSLILGSPALFTLIYDSFFKKSHISDPENQDVGGYILFLLICFITVDFLTYILMRDDNVQSKEISKECPLATVYRDGMKDYQSKSQSNEIETDLSSGENKTEGSLKEYGTTASSVSPDLRVDAKHKQETDIPEKQIVVHPLDLQISTSVSDNSTNNQSPNDRCEHIRHGTTIEQSDRTLQTRVWKNITVSKEEENTPLVSSDPITVGNHIPFIDLMKTPTLHCLTWGCAFALTSDTVIYANINVITLSASRQAETTRLIIMSRVFCCASAFLSGVFLNFVPHVTIRYCLLTVGCITVLLTNILFLCAAAQVWALYLGISLLGFGTGMIWVFGASLMFSFFGSWDYGRNWGMVIMMAFIISLLVSIVVGRLYDAKVSVLEFNNCIGEYCTRDWFIVLTALSFVSVVLSCAQLVLMYRDTSGKLRQFS